MSFPALSTTLSHLQALLCPIGAWRTLITVSIYAVVTFRTQRFSTSLSFIAYKVGTFQVEQRSNNRAIRPRLRTVFRRAQDRRLCCSSEVICGYGNGLGGPLRTIYVNSSATSWSNRGDSRVKPWRCRKTLFQSGGLVNRVVSAGRTG